jgi:hypothetical protein
LISAKMLIKSVISKTKNLAEKGEPNLQTENGERNS